MRALVVLVALLLVVGAACSGDDGGGIDSPVVGSIIRVTPQPAQAAGEPTPEGPELEGEPVAERWMLETGDCFNDYDVPVGDDPDELVSMTTTVDCRRPHDAEVYAEIVHPAGADVAYPGRRELELWATRNCYEAFAEFVGAEYELSDLEIGTQPPLEDNWNFGPYRTTECYVYAPDGQLSGSMRDSGV